MSVVDDKGDPIRITHYINPHMFWFKYLEENHYGNPDLVDLEHKLFMHYNKQKLTKAEITNFKPKLNEIVAVFHLTLDHYIRVQVDRILEYNLEENKYMLFAIDHGFTLHSVSKWLRKLPAEFQNVDLNIIHFGGLQGIVPSKLDYNYETDQAELKICDNWAKSACEMADNIINNAEEIHFKTEITANNQLFGELNITTTTCRSISLTNTLIKNQLAMLQPNFLKVLANIETNKVPRYKDNQYLTNLKYHENRTRDFGPSIRAEASVVAPSVVDENVSGISESMKKVVTEKIQNWTDNNFKLIEQKNRDDLESVRARPKLISAEPEEPHPSHSKAAEHYNNGDVSAATAYQKLTELKMNASRRPQGSPDGVQEMLSQNLSQTNYTSNRQQDTESNTSSGGTISRSERMLQRLRTVQNNRQSTAASAQPKVAAATQSFNFIPAGLNIGTLQHKKKDEPKSNNPFHNNNGPSSSDDSVVNHQQNGYAMNQQSQAGRRTINKPETSYQKALEKEQCLPSRLIGQRVLVHGHQLEKPIDSLSNANFPQEVHQVLKNQLRSMQFYRIQTYAWPHIMRRRSFIVINNGKTGKTLCYVPAIASLIKYDLEGKSIPNGVGPIAVVVCSSAKSAEIIKHDFAQYKLNTVLAFGLRDMGSVQTKLYNGCDILVVTPPCFTRIYNSDRNLFDPKRINYLVFDDIDMCMENFYTDLQEIFKVCRKGKTEKDDIQFIVTSKIWCPMFTELLNKCQQPVLCIGAYIEAAMYGKCQIKLHLLEGSKKHGVIMDFIANGRYENEKTIVICNNKVEVEELTCMLKSDSILCMACHEDVSAEELDIMRSWNRNDSDKNLMICSDSIFHDLAVDRAQNIIHFSMPEMWSTFCYRFSALFGYYQDLTSAEVENNRVQAVSLVLLDEANSVQLPHLIEFMNSHFNKNNTTTDWISSEINQLSKAIQAKREEEKISSTRMVPLCNLLLEFGKCSRSECHDRHCLSKFDLSNIKITGKVKLHILDIFSPVHYAARIMQHRVDGKWQPIKANFLDFAIDFAQHFSNVQNHKIHHPVHVGDMCVVADSANSTFNRCIVVEIIKTHQQKIKDPRLRVKLIDTGKVFPCQASELCSLPDEFKKYPPQAIDVRLSGIIPLDFETEWNRTVLKTIKNWTKQDTDSANKSIYLQGNIIFSLKNTVWVDSLEVTENLSYIDRQIPIANIKETLIEKKFCQKDNTAIHILQQMADELDCFLQQQVELAQPMLVSERKSSSGCDDSDERLSSISGNVIKPSDELQKTISSSDDEKYKLAEMVEQPVEPLHDEYISANSSQASESFTSIDQPVAIADDLDDASETWSVMDSIICYHSHIGYFVTPFDFYAQRRDQLKAFDIIDECINKYLANDTSEKRIDKPSMFMNCLALFDEIYTRAKIIDFVDETSVKLFFVDIGETRAYGLDEIIKTTKEIVEITPFLAMKCSLVGIKPKDSETWLKETTDKIYDSLIDPSECLFIRVIRLSNQTAPIYGMSCYDVLLVDCTTPIEVKINKHLVAIGLAINDPDTNHFLDLMLEKKKLLINLNEDDEDDDESDSEDWDAKCERKRNRAFCITQPDEEFNDYCLDFEFTEEDAREFVELPAGTTFVGPPMPSIMEKPTSPKIATHLMETAIIKEITSAGDLDKIFDQQLESTLDSDDLSEPQTFSKAEDTSATVQNDGMPQLINRYKYAKVTWQQNESVVRLVIAATDIKEYGLAVTSSVFQYVQIYGDEKENEILNINLFGCVDAKMTSHELRGLNIIVRLVKTLKGLDWLSLLRSNDKVNWLKYNYDSIVDIEAPPAQSLKTIRFNQNNSDDSDFEYVSDNDDFVDVYDPLQDDFK